MGFVPSTRETNFFHFPKRPPSPEGHREPMGALKAKALFPISVRLRYKDWDTDEEETEDPEESPALRKLWAKFITVVGSAVAGMQDTEKLGAGWEGEWNPWVRTMGKWGEKWLWWSKSFWDPIFGWEGEFTTHFSQDFSGEARLWSYGVMELWCDGNEKWL